MLLGATVTADGVHFSVASRAAEELELLLFERPDDPEPSAVLPMKPSPRGPGVRWHVHAPGARAGMGYAFRARGPDAPRRGQRFDPGKVLLDPYARAIESGGRWSHEAACQRGSNLGSAMRGIVVDDRAYDWQGVTRPEVAPEDRVIYEMHVRGFTRHPSSDVRAPGTFAGLAEKIPYLLDLGVTTVQLLPVFQFDELEVFRRNPITGERLTNYWGYSPLGFFAPHRAYAGAPGKCGTGHVDAFRDMVRALHRAGLEVFLDVVYNHTAEGDPRGPTVCFRGLDDATYYLQDQERPGRYADYSGCGNTLNANDPVVAELIVDSLRYWVEEMGVDGFRFDLASALCRGPDGEPMDRPPLLEAIEADPVLSRAHLIAEAWDAGGLYQVGAFPAKRWGEWNGLFRDDVRRFVRGDFGLARAMALRLTGSPDLYDDGERQPIHSINFVTCHDGFTLRDLVSYSRKHNAANGEHDRDGSNDNHSASYGIEGPTDEPRVLATRERQVHNLLTLLFIAHGTPMLLMGDEVGRTQGGNNNAYCQDNETSWLDWGLRRTNADLFRFVRGLMRLRRAHPNLCPSHWVTTEGRGGRRVRWHGVAVGEPDWSDGCRTLAYTLEGPEDDPVHVLINMHTEPLSFTLPELPGKGRWRRAVDTGRGSPGQLAEPGEELIVNAPAYRVDGRAVVVLIGRCRN